MDFKLPIEYLSTKVELDSGILNDLQLLDSSYNLYDSVFGECDVFGNETKYMWMKYYTSEVSFLKDSQVIYENMYVTDSSFVDNNEKILALSKKIETDGETFEETQNYIRDVYFCDKMNENEQIMMWYSGLLILSPILTLSMPIMIIIFPFILLKLQGLDITVSEYTRVILMLLKKIPIGKILDMDFSNLNSIMYTFFSIGIYFFQLYQSLTLCYAFKKNIFEGHDSLLLVRNYFKKTASKIEAFLTLSENKSSYADFNDDLVVVLKKIYIYLENLSSIPETKIGIPFKLGKIRCELYKLYKNEEYIKLFHFANGFNGYYNNIEGLAKNIGVSMNKAKYNVKKTNMKKMHYPAIVGDKKYNSMKLNNNKIITGVNASGKTTLLKMTLFNVIISQQIGFGFYKKGDIFVYDKIHCYLNIPDTNGRDSLFQAEARRCKEIIDSIDEDPNKNHLCVFDELYSGTNPYEACAAGYAYLKYLSRKSNVRFLLTTHYLDMCERLSGKSQKSITNYYMEAFYDGSKNLVYTYTKKKGITKIKGGVEVLKWLDYPKIITKEATDIINEI